MASSSVSQQEQKQQHRLRNNASPYSEASQYLNILLTNPTISLKSLAFSATAASGAGIKLPKKQQKSGSSSTTTLTCSKSTYATLSQLLHHKAIIDDILSTKTPGLAILSQCRNKSLVYVLLYELLFSKFKKIRGGGAAKRVILGYESSLRELASSSSVRVRVSFPRYVRVNSLFGISLTEVARVLRRDVLTDSVLYVDRHVRDLLVLPPGTDLHDHALVRKGHVVLQDKSSCFPALVLTAPPMSGGDVIDACAAPGNKTSHLAALLSSSSKRRTIFAVERDERRMTLLEERMTTLGAEATVNLIHDDFLKLSPSDDRFTNVTAILLDPSCSGSGMIHRPKIRVRDSQRKEALTNFQAMALRHAMSFPQVNRIVYSTCSIDVEENEAIVGGLLRGDEITHALDDQWAVASAPKCLKGDWTRRGIEGAGGLTREETQRLVRCDGTEDDTCGFFVCLLVRKSEEDTTTTKEALDHPTEIHADDATASSIPFYDGQFKTTPCVDKNPVKKTTDADTTTTTTTPSPTKTTTPSSSTTTKTTLSSSSHGTKKEKRLKWKQKQAAMKTKRLKKKKMKLLQTASLSSSSSS